MRGPLVGLIGLVSRLDEQLLDEVVLDGSQLAKLKRAVFFHERGEIRDRSFESQAFRASGLNLVVSAIVHWNTVYLDRAAPHLRLADRIIPHDLLKHVSPLRWEHINFTGIYTWDSEPQMPEGFKIASLASTNPTSGIMFMFRSTLAYDLEQLLF